MVGDGDELGLGDKETWAAELTDDLLSSSSSVSSNGVRPALVALKVLGAEVVEALSCRSAVRLAQARLIAVHGTALVIGALFVVVGALLGMLVLAGTLANPYYRHAAWLVVRFGAALVLMAWPYRTRHVVAGAVLCAAATSLAAGLPTSYCARGLGLQIACGGDWPDLCALGGRFCLVALIDLLHAVGAIRLECALRVRPILSTHTVLARFWRVSGQTLIAQGTLDVVLIGCDPGHSTPGDRGIMVLALVSVLQEAAMGVALISPGVRSAVQGWLAARGTAVKSATSIALLFGATEDVEQLARERFTCVKCRDSIHRQRPAGGGAARRGRCVRVSAAISYAREPESKPTRPAVCKADDMGWHMPQVGSIPM
ncbi:hypothetical protein T492DRAFT_1131676 [Pavlovales sp. CCMP2436]|nr:hypothetical protein T492DRAFT_1131676 [Pavlovales sp. CCMP2436]